MSQFTGRRKQFERPAQLLGCTHFFMVSPDRAKIFKLDHCENCHGKIQAGAVTVFLRREDLLDAGLYQVSKLPVEGYHSDDLGGEACENCNG